MAVAETHPDAEALSARPYVPRPDQRPTPPAGNGRLPYFAGLDGLRGVAVIAVLVFHGGFTWAVGGYLGVSTFFTLSGFLITSLLLAERTTTRSIDIRAFWGRRLRRLIPASLGALTLVLLYSVMAASATQQRSLGGDVTSSLLDVANWHFIFSHQSYSDVFSAPSPVLHFWSLAIEEQFYLVYPVMALGLLAALKWNRWRFGQALGVLMALSLAATLFLGYSHDRIYFGTETRAFELLIGGVLGVAIYSRRVTRRLARPGPHRRAAALVGAGALAVCVVLWVNTPQTAGWLYRGGFAAYSLLTCLVILATIVPWGPVARLMSWSALRRVGLLSYGIYLYHWPIFLWIDQDRTGLSIWPLFVVRVAVTGGLAFLSFRFLEQPVRRGTLTVGGRPALYAAPVIAVLIALTAWMITADAPKPLIDFAAGQRTLSELGAGRVTPATDAAGRPLSVQPPKVAVFGDSTSLVVGVGIADVDQEQGLVEEVSGGAGVGCGLGRGGQFRSTGAPRISGTVSDACNSWPDDYQAAFDKSRPDIALMMEGPWDVFDRKLPGDSQWRSFGDPTYDDYYTKEMLAFVDEASANGAKVVWLTSPAVSNKPERTDRMNELIRQLPDLRPGKVVVVDLAGYLAGTGQDKQMRPDKIHLSPDAARQVAREFIIPQLDGIWKQAPPDSTSTATTTSTPGA